MDAAPAGSVPQPPESASRGAHRHRGSRRGRNQGRGGRVLEFRPASVTPATPSASTSDSGEQTSSTSRQSNRGRRGRGGRPSQNRTVNGRQFGGQLTGDSGAVVATNPDQLQAHAPVFVPGQAVQSKQTTRQQLKQHQKRPPKSQAPDIATRTHEDIDHGYYECPICTSEVQRKSKVWSCHTCWTVFHLSCIKKWSTNEGSAAARQQIEGDIPPPRQWRCPGCNLPKDELPSSYTCWCEKELEPRAPAGVPPHSCGQTCGRERARKCPHPCELTCHAGPCPPCGHMGPTQMCFCGKHDVTKRCSETDYDSGWSCGEVCDELMPCGEHTHEALCHPGLCGACEVRVPARCYCGQVEKEMLCSDRGEERQSTISHSQSLEDDATERWTGSFDCGNQCGRAFDCGVADHACHRPCHPQNAQPGHCPRSPDVVDHCSCGKTSLTELTNEIRQTCEDPIPSCQQPCGKILPCGHECTAICHTGECPSCRQTIEIKCRCGRTSSKSICHQGNNEPPQCARVCRTALSCRRHACDERCCTGERKAIDRQSMKKKQRPIISAPRMVDDGFEPEHICTRQCGRLLKCGTHVCEELCHNGPCGTCREAVFEEVSCHCGRTVLHPPLPCGTKPPPCRYPCTRPKACGHAQVAHNCHGDDEACPKCPFLVQKKCMCGKRALKNQPCWLQDVRCGEVCGKKLRCGSHQCRKSCHRPGECEDAHGQPCQQPCGKPKKVCGHPDEDLCHSPFTCKEDKPCQSKIFITCQCQAQKQEMKCGASKAGEGNNGRTLACTDECSRLERNRKLALALNIDQSTHKDGGDHILYSAETLYLFSQNVKWAQTQEREFRVFATSDDERRLRFKPMKAQERAFVHALAEDFGLDSESMDPEPHRHVMIWKTPRFVSAPNKTLAEALRVRQTGRPLVGSEGAVKKPKSREPYNAFLISNVRFGLTIDELKVEMSGIAHDEFSFDFDFLANDKVLIRPTSRTIDSNDPEKSLGSLKPAVASAIAAKGFGKNVELCTTDASLNVLHRESDHSSIDGWSKVATKKLAPRITTQNGSFEALSGDGKITFAKKKPLQKSRPVVVADDWEAAETAEEAKEQGADEIAS